MNSDGTPGVQPGVPQLLLPFRHQLPQPATIDGFSEPEHRLIGRTGEKQLVNVHADFPFT